VIRSYADGVTLMQPLDAQDPAFVGPYRLIARLGEGGMGRVYLGMSAGRRVVAVKVIHADHSRDREFRDRFKIEVEAAKKVQAAFTAPVIDADADDDPPWLVTSLVAGPSLADVIKSLGPLPEVSVWRLAAGLAEALAAVHDCGIVHRDVTPGNVLLALDGPRLIDFGLARALGSSNLTATGIVIGTPAFLSPEHVNGDPVGPASDIFSLGSLLVFASTGTGPFGSGDPMEVFGRILAGELDFRGMDGRLLEVAAACLVRDPARRPSPAEIIESAPADTGLPADGLTTQFWPTPLDAFIRSCQASFDVVMPDRRTAGQQSTLSFKPPKEIVAEATGLTERGQADNARLLLANAAALRPDQEVAALLSLLRTRGLHAQAEVVLEAAVRRPAAEVAALTGVLRQLGSDADVDNLLDQAAGEPPERIGAIVAALASTGQTAELRRLLRGAASNAPRQPQGIVALVGTLSSAGLSEEATRLANLVATLVTPSQAAALGDAMRRSGYQEAALSLYSAAAPEIALRAPAEIASFLSYARDAQKDELAGRLVQALTARRSETAEVIDLAAALASATLDDDAQQVLAAAAAAVPLGGVIEITEALLAMNQEKAALSVCTEAAANDPAETGVLLDALRDIGRPVDAFRLLDDLGTRPAGRAAEVIAGLRATGRAPDADRVLRSFVGQGPEAVCDLLARLGQLGAEEDGSHLAAVMDPGLSEPLRELASSLLKRRAYRIADHLLARAATERGSYCCEQIDVLQRTPTARPALQARSSSFPTPSRRAVQEPDAFLFAVHWQAHHEHGGLLSCLRNLRAESLGVATHELLSFAARLPAEDLARFAGELDWADGPAQSQPTRATWSGTREAAALVAAATRQATSDLGVVLQSLLDRPDRAVLALLSALTTFPDDVVIAVAMGLNATVPKLLPGFIRIASGVLPAILARDIYYDNSGLLNTYADVLRAAGSSLPSEAFCHLYLMLRERMLPKEASLLLKEAARNSAAPEIITQLKDRRLRSEAKELAQAIRVFPT
jgi:hypothetical protein